MAPLLVVSLCCPDRTDNPPIKRSFGMIMDTHDLSDKPRHVVQCHSNVFLPRRFGQTPLLANKAHRASACRTSSLSSVMARVAPTHLADRVQYYPYLGCKNTDLGRHPEKHRHLFRHSRFLVGQLWLTLVAVVLWAAIPCWTPPKTTIFDTQTYIRENPSLAPDQHNKCGGAQCSSYRSALRPRGVGRRSPVCGE